MKNLYHSLAIALCFCFTISSFAQIFNQKEISWDQPWMNFNPNTTNYPEAAKPLPKIISTDLFLSNDKTYFISGDVYVTNGASLSIQEGTIIRCDHQNPANLIITKGSRLIAAGSANAPIVFTSAKAPKQRQSGDWGGIAIAGSGKINSISGTGVMRGDFSPNRSEYGGELHDEQTTILRYVRVEFAGNKEKRISGSNGLSLYGIGKQSIVDNIMVSHSGQDSYNIKGGACHFKNLISLKAEDDDFQVSDGFKGEFTGVLAVRHPYVNSQKGSYALEVHGYDNRLGSSDKENITDIIMSDATLVNLSTNSNSTHTRSAIYASNAAMMYLHKTKISGFSDVVQFDRSYTSAEAIENSFSMDNSFFNIHGKGVQVASEINDVQNILKYNRFTQNFTDVGELFYDPYNQIAPKFNLKQSPNSYMVMQ